MQLFTYFAALCATAGTLSSAMPADLKAERTTLPVTGKALTVRGTDDPLIPSPQVSQVILYAATLILFGNLFGFQIEDEPIPNAPPPPQEPPVVGGVGASSLVARLQNRVNANLGGQVNVITTILMNGRPVIFQISMEAVNGLTWAHIAAEAGGFQNLQNFVENSVQTALTESSAVRTFALAARTNADQGQGVQLAVLHWIMRPAQ